MSKPGVKRGQYKEKVVLGYIIPKRGNLRGEKFLAEFVYRNQELLTAQYEKQKKAMAGFKKRPGQEKSALEKFLEKNPTVYEFTKSRFSKDSFFNRKTITEVIERQLATSTQKQMLNIKKRIESDPKFYEDLLFAINEELDYTRLQYSGSGVYRYITQDGRIIRFKFIDYSTADTGAALLEFLYETE